LLLPFHRWVANNPLRTNHVDFTISGLPVNSKLAGSRDVQPKFKTLRQLYGGGREKASRSADDMYYLAEQLVKSGHPIPKLYVACGTEDPVAYQNYLDFQVLAKKIGLPVQHAVESGQHDWKVWDSQIQKGLDFPGLTKTGR
jgi:S-formylglutathione hydrolase FrmB